MNDLTRRTFIGGTGAAVAATGAVVALPALVSVVTDEPIDAAIRPDGSAVIDLTEPVVLHVSNPAAGEITVLVGEQSFVVTDPDLVARISRSRS